MTSFSDRLHSANLLGPSSEKGVWAMPAKHANHGTFHHQSLKPWEPL